jgi:hypothetical protein
MKKVFANELKIGDILINIGKINKIDHVRAFKAYCSVYCEGQLYPIIYESNEEVYIEVTSKI